MTLPNDPQEPTYDDRRVAEPMFVDPGTEELPPPEAPPVATAETVPVMPAAPVAPGQPEESEKGAGGKVKAAALLAGAAALANKVRQKAPEKVQEIRQKRAAGRCVILTELDGRTVAIGPYSNDQAARQDITKVTGAPRVIELVPQKAYFAAPPSDVTALP